MDRDNDNSHSIKVGDYVHWKKSNISSWVSEVLEDNKAVYLKNTGYAPIAEIELATPPKVMHIDYMSLIIELPNGILLYRDDKNVFQLNSSGLGTLK